MNGVHYSEGLLIRKWERVHSSKNELGLLIWKLKPVAAYTSGQKFNFYFRGLLFTSHWLNLQHWTSVYIAVCGNFQGLFFYFRVLFFFAFRERNRPEPPCNFFPGILVDATVAVFGLSNPVSCPDCSAVLCVLWLLWSFIYLSPFFWGGGGGGYLLNIKGQMSIKSVKLLKYGLEVNVEILDRFTNKTWVFCRNIQLEK